MKTPFVDLLFSKWKSSLAKNLRHNFTLMSTGLVSIRSGLGRTLFIWFLLFSFLPLSVAAWIEHQQARQALHVQAERSLALTLNYQVEHIERFFVEKVAEMEHLLTTDIVVTALERLQHTWGASGLSLSEFVTTPGWHMRAELFSMELSRFLKNPIYEDVLLVDLKGNILFSMQKSSELGQNLFSEPLSSTFFGQTARQALSVNSTLFAVMGSLGGGHDQKVGYLLHSILDPLADPVGVLALRISLEALNTELMDDSMLLMSGKSFLIGSDFLPRFVVAKGEIDQTVLPMQTILIHFWQRKERLRHGLHDVEAPFARFSDDGVEQVLAFDRAVHYRNHLGVEVIGMIRNITSLEGVGLHWALLVEVDAAEAEVHDQNMGRKTLFLLAVIGVMVLIFAAFIVGGIVFPLQQLTQWARRQADGDFRLAIIPVTSHELGVLASSFQKLVDILLASTETLKTQQVELSTAYAAVRHKANRLEESKVQLEITSEYKSQFLARMSHELRTPLNSILILARLLAKNKQNNLTADQVESVEVIHASGEDLLQIINDILDLAKLESGKMEILHDLIQLDTLVEVVNQRFVHVAADKGLIFLVEKGVNAPVQLVTDLGKLMQIITNLVGNAIKFTYQGGVVLHFLSAQLSDGREALAVQVKDTGPGSPLSKQTMIFDAFQQVDGTTSRQYGGTGLGLSISLELAQLLGGEITLQSEIGQGSTFSLLLPIVPPVEFNFANALLPLSSVESGSEQHASENSTDSPLLLISADSNTVQLVMEQARHFGVEFLFASSGHRALGMLRQQRPFGIILDLVLPDLDGWELLTHLKSNELTRLIPVFLISLQSSAPSWQAKGALGHLPKPLLAAGMEDILQRLQRFSDQKARTLLVVDDEPMTRQFISLLFAPYPVIVTMANSGEEALVRLENQHFDCMILDLHLPGMQGADLLAIIEKNPLMVVMPVVIYSALELSREDYVALRRYTGRIISKGGDGEVKLLEQVMMLLHLTTMPQAIEVKQPESIRSWPRLIDKKVLIVDHDMRASYALIKLLKVYKLKAQAVMSGSRALGVLQSGQDIDCIVISMNQSMQVACETIQVIKNDHLFDKINIIVLLDSLSASNRDACLQAGADCVLVKPVDPDTLLVALDAGL